MTEYEIIDLICDSISPLLLLMALGISIRESLRGNYQKAGTLVGFLVGGMLWIYGLRYLDSLFHWWPAFGSDYSTHTAFILVVCVTISMGVQATRWLTGVFIAYMLAMMYQDYHTLLDIVSTTLVVGGLASISSNQTSSTNGPPTITSKSCSSSKLRRPLAVYGMRRPRFG